MSMSHEFMFGPDPTPEEWLKNKEPIRYNPDGDKTYWAWFRHYENHPKGFWRNLLPTDVFDRIREDEGLAATDADGNPPYAIGFDTEEEAWEAAIKAAIAIWELENQLPEDGTFFDWAI